MPISKAGLNKVHPWLHARGSLTARLRTHGAVTVHVVFEGVRALWPQEKEHVHCRNGYVREVVLCINGRPAVWARSAISHAALRGPWRAMAQLGKRPLAELLFQRSPIKRSPLHALHVPKHGAIDTHIRAAWTENASPRWARTSVFWHKSHPLHLMEAFAPWVFDLPCLMQGKVLPYKPVAEGRRQ